MQEMKYPDIFFTEEYQELFKDTEFGGEPCQFTCAGIDYRFYKRPIPNTPYFDIVSPYGYSGPVVVDEFINWGEFLLGFKEHCTQNNIIAEFARLHPFYDTMRNTQSIPALFGTRNTCNYEHDIFYVDLTQSESEIWSGFDKGCKSAVKSCKYKTWTSWEATWQFVKLYTETMQRKQAKEYIFSEDFFKSINPMHCQTFGADDNKFNTVSAILVLHYGDYAHYFLSGSHEKGATNLLLWDAIKWSKSQGCKIFNLGGGLKAGDSLESFKRSFSKLSVPFYTYRKIHDTEVYNKLCEVKGIDPESKGYFPAYRREN